MTLHRYMHLQLMHKLHQSTAYTSLFMRAMPCNGKQTLRQGACTFACFAHHPPLLFHLAQMMKV